jgi:hypothetical protein
MKLAVITFPQDNYYHEAAELNADKNLIYSASEAADKMEFETPDELQDAVKRAMELCISTGLPVNCNFKRFFKSTALGIICDWKLSALAYHLVQLNGGPSNPQVARMQFDLLKMLF